jgi:hypothetical protein
MKPRNLLNPGRTSTLQERHPPAVRTSNPPASNDSCEDGCFFCTGPETD